VTQIELVILGKEKELTLIDDSGRILAVNKPITRIVALNYRLPELFLHGMPNGLYDLWSFGKSWQDG